MTKNCPTCGRPLTLAEQVVAECDPRQQCHFCWHRLNLARPPRRGAGGYRKPEGLLPSARDLEPRRRAA